MPEVRDAEFKGLCAVFVLYMSNPSDIIDTTHWLIEAGGHIVLIDNTPEEPASNTDLADLPASVIHHRMGSNTGIATALNKGVDLCRDLAMKHVITFDQDSRFDASLIRRMLAEYKSQRLGFDGPLALGPLPVNARSGASYLRRSDRLRQWVRFHLLGNKAPAVLRVRELITSGLMADMPTYDAVGRYDDSLFIDFVDHDWTWRLARKSGRCFIVLSAEMSHMIGVGDIPFTGGMRLGSPHRLFFLFRNATFLALTGKMPLFDAVKFLALVPVKFFVFSFLKDRLTRWSEMTRGLSSGFSAALRGHL